MTFWVWLQQQRDRRDAIGDLARDAVADATFPRRARRMTTLRRYLDTCEACDTARLALVRAHREWRARLLP